ncbi:MAG: hypothetical protein KGM24_15450, partial [Elusimicrobia bacterium]|nr:hypothetical protein [Elusimicrobiota bacterium]
ARARPGGDMAGDCALYAGMFGRERPDAVRDAPQARVAFRAGLAAHRRGDDAAAQVYWTDCLDRSAVGTLVRDLCLAGLDRITPPLPKPATPGAREAHKMYLEGVAAYARGDSKTAGRRWRTCLAADGANAGCRAGLRKLDDDARKAAAGQK